MTGSELAMRKTETVRVGALEPAAVTSRTPWMMRIEEHPSWGTLDKLRVSMRAGVALSSFKVRDLLALKEGQVFESVSLCTEDVPVRVAQIQLGWAEFEVLEQRMALRVTRLG